jgi:Icc-related predicted phosphoesterase
MKQAPICYFASDLHGAIDKYRKLFKVILDDKPVAIFLGGDILPSGLHAFGESGLVHHDFINGFLLSELSEIKKRLEDDYPRIFVILGNDDGRLAEAAMLDAAARGFWEYINERKIEWGGYQIYGYCYIPPTPFLLKDWERYDVSRYVDPGAVSPEKGYRSIPMPDNEKKYATIRADLEKLAGQDNLDKAVFLFHSPPYRTKLDCSALEGNRIDGVPVDAQLGSVAIRRFIEDRQPLITLHGHIHESTRISGTWKDKIGRTRMFNAAHDGRELSLIKFSPDYPDDAERVLI